MEENNVPNMRPTFDEFGMWMTKEKNIGALVNSAMRWDIRGIGNSKM